MLTSTITAPLLTAVLACAGTQRPNTKTHSAPDVEAPDTEDDVVLKDQHFCCDHVKKNKDGNGSGEGCTLTSKEYIAACTAVLYCSGDWGLEDGKAECY